MRMLLASSTSRRTLLALAGAGAAVLVAPGCSRNETTGRTQLVMIGEEQLAAMSQSAWAELKAAAPVSTDAAAQKRLARIGASVAEASGAKALDWEFVVFDNPEVNAFVLPGGKVGFNTGLMQLAQSDAEIAAVMGHEVGHVVARHAAERMSQHVLAQMGVQAATLLLAGELGHHADEVAGVLGVGLIYGIILPYSRAHELEADRLGVRLMADAGYDPAGATAFWERLIARNAQSQRPIAWLSTHPADDDRLIALRTEVARFAPADLALNDRAAR